MNSSAPRKTASGVPFSQRRVACDLVRGLCRNFNGTVTALCMAHVQELMAAYAAQPAGADAKKEAAIALVIALSAKVHTQANGGIEGVPAESACGS